jgi:uncharacterized membrane protein YeiB
VTAAVTPAPGRVLGLDLARSLAMLGMLVTHTLLYPTTQPKGVLWTVYGRAAPLFVLLAGAGLVLMTRSGRPRARAAVAVRSVLLLLIGMALSIEVDGVILQSYALFFLVGILLLHLPTLALGGLSATFLVGGPLLLTALDRSGGRGPLGGGVGFDALSDPLGLLRTLTLDHYPAVTWFGFFLAGMVLARVDLRSAANRLRLLLGGAAATALLFTAGWIGAERLGPEPLPFSIAPPHPSTWSGHWTTYGHSGAIGWALSSTALALAVVGACVCLLAPDGVARRVLAPAVALGQTALTFYLLHFLYLDTLWLDIQPELTSTEAFFLASLVFWMVFAVGAWMWLRVFRRGPLESVLHVVSALVVAGPGAVEWRAARPPAARPAT